MKNFLFVLPLFSLTIQSADAIKTASLEDDAIALEAGRNAPAVCCVRVLLNEGDKDAPLDFGSGSLVASNIIITVAHMFVSDKRDQEIVPGVPMKVSGFVTFAADATRAISDFENDPTLENLSAFYEIDSFIVHPGYTQRSNNYTDRSDKHDIAFIKLKRPVEGIKPIPLYSKGTIPESKLKIHNQELAVTDEKMSAENLLIDAYGYGYGLDVFQKPGQKRGVYLPTFIGIDIIPFETDSSEESEDNQIDLGSYSSSSDSGEDDAAIRELNEGDIVSLTSYFSGPRVSKSSRSFSKGISISKIQKQFHDRLYEVVKKKEETSGIVRGGDSGGPLLVSEKIVGIISSGSFADNALMKHVKDFSDVRELYRSVDSRVTPLFNYKTGELRPELPEMIEALQAHPLSDESNLKDLILFNKKRRQELFAAPWTLAIADLKTLMLPNVTYEDVELIRNQYSTPGCNINIDLREELNHFKSGELEAFRERIQKLIETIDEFLKK